MKNFRKEKKEETEKVEHRIKHLTLWPLKKLAESQTPKVALKFPIYMNFLGAIPPQKSEDAWAQNLAFSEVCKEINEDILKYLITISVKSGEEVEGIVKFASSSIARALVHREESVAGGAMVPAGVSDDGTHIWSSTIPIFDGTVLVLNGDWQAGIDKFILRAGIAEAEGWFLPGKDFSVHVYESKLGKAVEPMMEEE